MGCHAYLRPIHAVSWKFTADIFGVGATQLTIPDGVYSFFTLLAEVKTQLLTTALASTLTEITPDFQIRIGDTDSIGDPNFALEFDNANDSTDLAIALGFTANGFSSPYHVSNRQPMGYYFFPTYSASDRARLALDQNGLFRGETAQSGQIAGLTTHDNLHYREVEYSFETAEKVWIEAGEDVLTWSGSTYYLDELNCWEYFVDKCRTVYPTANTVNQKGFYFLPDYSIYVSTNAGDAPATALPTTVLGAGGIRFNIDTSPDGYVWCNLELRGLREPSPALETGIAYYSCSIPFHTSTPPVFD